MENQLKLKTKWNRRKIKRALKLSVPAHSKTKPDKSISKN